MHRFEHEIQKPQLCKHLPVGGSWNHQVVFLLNTSPKKWACFLSDKMETPCRNALLVSSYEAFICSYFSPMLPPFCFWNSMYRRVLAKKASADGSDALLSFCFSVLISSIKSWMTVFVICGIPFSKKYRYLKIIQVWELQLQQINHISTRKDIRYKAFTCSKFQWIEWQIRCFPLIHWPFVEQHLQFSRHALSKGGPCNKILIKQKRYFRYGSTAGPKLLPKLDYSWRKRIRDIVAQEISCN